MSFCCLGGLFVVVLTRLAGRGDQLQPNPSCISAGLSFSADHRDVISTTYVVLVFRAALENLKKWVRLI